MENVKDIINKIKKVENELEIEEKKRADIIRKIGQLKSNLKELKDTLNRIKSKEVSRVDWAALKCLWEEDIYKLLRGTFKLQQFRHQQLAAINATLSKKDLILLMPTGGGKSLCYQLPALLTNGVTIVISPLLSLIEDQVLALQKLGVNAVALNSSTNSNVTKEIFEQLKSGKISIKLIYVTPEWFAKSKRFLNNLQKCYSMKKLDRIAIDEVHCCSQWGHDFRPDYKFLGILKTIFPDIPIIGLTATATESVIIDCQKMLNIEGCIILKATYNRANLFYEVIQKPSYADKAIQQLIQLIKDKFNEKSGIVYTTTINESVDIAKELKKAGVSTACYHANMDNELRRKIHQKWISNDYKVVVATVAFGMGIDKPDVRFVIHFSIPKSMASFYQESGRAGRNDQRADCILFYSYKDVFKVSSMVCSSVTGTENLFEVVKYCLDVKSCRRSIIAQSFDEVWDSTQCNKMCDHCLYNYAFIKTDITSYCKDIHMIITEAAKTKTRLTPNKVLDSWLKSGNSKSNQIVSLKTPPISRQVAELILMYLLLQGYLKEEYSFNAYNTISYLNIGPTPIFDVIKMNIRTIETNSSTKKRKSTQQEKAAKIPKIIELSE